MLVINTRNVNGAWPVGIRHIVHHGVAEESRAGRVLAMPTPVTTVYQRPQERVLFCGRRDANPFFHLFESVWMLMGRSDATWLDRYVSDFSSRFAEEDGILHGAYGWRWRGQFYLSFTDACDQLDAIVRILQADPGSRQAVLAMWDPHDDLGAVVRDKPCNTHCYFRLHSDLLDMTILCRSNDVIWGAYGANAVHMSVLQEYMAARIGVQVGTMYQVSNNYHVYTEVLERMFPEDARHAKSHMRYEVDDTDMYRQELTATSPLFRRDQDWAALHDRLMAWSERPTLLVGGADLIDQLLVPMSRVHHAYKNGDLTAAHALCDHIQHDDWRVGCQMWVDRRLRLREERRAAEQKAQIDARLAALQQEG